VNSTHCPVGRREKETPPVLRVVEKPTKENEELRTTLDEVLQRGALKMLHEALEAQSMITSGGTARRAMTAGGRKWSRKDRLCTLVMIGVRADRTKELIGVEDGYHESTESWATVLRNLKCRCQRVARREEMASKVGPWFSSTWWGKRHLKINVSLLIALLLFLLWKSFF
jgi:hypothetical protein